MSAPQDRDPRPDGDPETSGPLPPDEPPMPASVPRRAAGRRWLILALLLTLLPFLALGLVLGTQSGLRGALALNDRLLPGVLSVGRADGRLLGRLHLESVALHLPALDLAIGAVDLGWSPGSVLGGRLRIQRLEVRDLDLRLAPTPDTEQTPLVLPRILLPVDIEVERATLDRLRLFAGDAPEPGFVLDRAALAGRLAAGELTLTELAASLPAPALAARAHGRIGLHDDYPLDLALDWDLGLPPAARLHGVGAITGSLEQLRIRHRLDGSLTADLQAEVQGVLSRPAWDVQLGLERVDLTAFGPDLPALAVAGRLQSAGDLESATLAASLDASLPARPDLGRLALVLDGVWRDRVLRLARLQLTEPPSAAGLDARGELDLSAQPGRFSFTGSWRDLRWPLDGEPTARSTRGDWHAAGTFDAYDYGFSADLAGAGLPAARVELQGKGTADATGIERLAVATLGGMIEGQGRLAWSPALDWDLALSARDLDPSALVAGLQDRIGAKLSSKGGLDGFDYDLALVTSGPGLPPAKLALGGAGDRRQVRVERLRLDALGGSVTGEARLGLAPQVSWDARLALAGVDPGTYAPAWPGRIDGRLTTQGRLEPTGPDLTVAIESLAGRLRGYPIAASGKVALQGKALTIEALTASSGPSRARVDGRIQDSLDLTFSLQSPDLASLLPDAGGSLAVSGQARGRPTSPRLTLDLAAREVKVAGQGIASLSGKADLDLAPDGRLQLRLDGKDLAAGGLRWSRLTLQGDGSLPNHRFSAALDGQPLALALEGSGGLARDGAYRGRLARFDLDSTKFGAWRLQRPFTLDLAPPRIAAGPLCLRERGGSGGCLEFAQTAAGRWTGSIDLDKLGLDLLGPLLPANLVADGQARVKGRFQAAGAVLSGKATAEIPSGRLSVAAGQGRRETLDLSGTRVALDAGAAGLQARATLPIQDVADLKAELRLPGWRLTAPAAPGQRLDGRLQATVSGLARVARLVPDLAKVSGALDADLALAGTLGQPRLRGRASLRDGGFELPLYALRVSQLDLDLRSVAAERMVLSGGARVGGGQVTLSGSGGFGGAGFGAEVRLQGDRLKVADTKDYYLVLSPDLALEAGAKGAWLRGEVRVPEARIRPRSVPAGTQSPSADVVMASGKREPPYPFGLDVQLTLGDEVSIDAFGVRGRLGGHLRILRQPGKDLLGDGQLQILDGEYRLSSGFGLAADLAKPLTINQGRLVYAKSPLDNPGLLLQAERSGGETTASVRVLGTLRTPKLSFFSETDPSMTPAEITKYLMTGIPPSGSDKAGQASLAVGTYIRPKVYMEYESGLGSEPNKVKLRYDLSRHVELQTETGESQGADIYFKFEN